MTAAEYQAQHGRKARKPPALPRTPPSAPVPSSTGNEARHAPDLPTPHYSQDNGAATWLLGQGQAVSRAREFEAGRHRLVVTGPVDEKLLKHILAYKP